MNLNKILNRETITYIVIGILTTLIDWTAYIFLSKIGINYTANTICSWLLAVIFAFISNKFIVFKSMNINFKNIIKEFSAFVIARILSLVLSLVLMKIFIDFLNMNEFFSKAVISIAILALNYILSKLIIFRKDDNL